VCDCVEWRTCSRRYSVISWLFISSAAEELVISNLDDCSRSSSPLASLSSRAGTRIGPGGAIGMVSPLASTSGRRLPQSMGSSVRQGSCLQRRTTCGIPKIAVAAFGAFLKKNYSSKNTREYKFLGQTS